jgi:predicted nucleotidyltransferase component of viral defense system
MESIAFQLEAVVDQHTAALKAMLKDKLAYKPSPSKWSKKEIIGHMVDSAQNNIRRFIIAQYEENPMIVYKQDNWVAISNYQNYDAADLINLWHLLNKHIAIILKNTKPEMMQRKCQTENSHTLEWLAEDYLKHLRHHLHQVLDLEPVAYP